MVGIGVSVKGNWMGWVRVRFLEVRLRFWRLRLWGGGSAAWGWCGRLLGSLEDDGVVERGGGGIRCRVVLEMETYAMETRFAVGSSKNGYWELGGGANKCTGQTRNTEFVLICFDKISQLEFVSCKVD